MTHYSTWPSVETGLSIKSVRIDCNQCLIIAGSKGF